MDPPTATTSSATMQLLTRPPNKPEPSSQSSSVVVIGFISQKQSSSSQLLNRILDDNVFGLSNPRQRDFLDGIELPDEFKHWLKCFSINYYHEEEKGLLFLQFSRRSCPAEEEDGKRFSFSGLDELEFGELQGLLFMFTVCHIILYIQEGSHFDTQLLRKIRVLQAAKTALAPAVRSRFTSSGASNSHSSSSLQPSILLSSANNPSTGRTGGILSRSSSSVSLMSGSGSHSSLLPGHCTPVILFVFLDDFIDIKASSSSSEDLADDSSLSQSSGSSSIAKPGVPVKGSGSVVMLARPISKPEGGFRKKLQSSLEAQIRFLVKKCRVLTGSQITHGGSRGGGVSGAAPLFSLDASRAVAFVDRSANQKGKSLEFASNLVEEILNGKATSDSLLHENLSQSASQEDTLSVKDFIYCQSDILKGRGGSVGGSAAGAGMVAVAAAAAAASASSGKSLNTPGPELPKIEIWLNSSQFILQGLLSARRGFMDNTEVSKRKSRQRTAVLSETETSTTKTTDPLNIAISRLETGKGIDTRFSTLWCQRALPTATEVYLRDLPACYPTLQHEAHLQRALHAFHSMVRGPAAPLFAKKLEDECTTIWLSGRQLCDAISLTGKACMHQRHDLKPHSSGFFFFHACACGRSRKLRPDPFDFETANSTDNFYMECDKLLSALQLPKVSHGGPVGPSSWSLLRVGGSSYYEPSKGLLQSGFCSTEKFLLKWTIFLVKHGDPKNPPASDVQQVVMIRSIKDSGVDAEGGIKNGSATELFQGAFSASVESKKYLSLSSKPDDKDIRFGTGLPNVTTRKPFAEVVAGSAAADSAFPPLQQRKQKLVLQEDQSSNAIISSGKVQIINPLQESEKCDVSFAQASSSPINLNGLAKDEQLLHIGSTVFPVTINGGVKTETNSSPNYVTAYVGFEHECPRGHRFILTPDHLNDLHLSYQLPKESPVSPAKIKLDGRLAAKAKFTKNSGLGRVQRQSNGNVTTVANKMTNLDRLKVMRFDGNPQLDGVIPSSVMRQNGNLTSTGMSTHLQSLEESFQSVSLDDGGTAFSLLNRNLPIYMHCPHCRVSKQKKDPQNVKFAGSISQLQRIFLATPPFPVVLALAPVVQFEASCLPVSIPDKEGKLKFSLRSQVILPPDSLLTFHLPFIYGVQLEDGNSHPLNPFEDQPELTAWLVKGTALQIVSKGSGQHFPFVGVLGDWALPVENMEIMMLVGFDWLITGASRRAAGDQSSSSIAKHMGLLIGLLCISSRRHNLGIRLDPSACAGGILQSYQSSSNPTRNIQFKTAIICNQMIVA